MTLLMYILIAGLIFSNYLLWQNEKENNLLRIESTRKVLEVLDNATKVLDNSEELRTLILETIKKNKLQ